MKKRLLRVFAIATMICLLAAEGVFATSGGLTVESVFPADGSKGLQITNQMARIVFNGEIKAKDNEKYFKIVDEKGKAQKIMILDQEDDPNRINLILTQDLKESSEYTIVVDGDVTDTKGNKLGKDAKFKFTTKSMKTDSIVTMVMMVVMCAAIVVFTVRDQAKKQREAAEEARKGSKKPQKVNPYKEAKQEAEKIRARKQKEKQQKVQEAMRKNQNKAKSKKK